MAKTVAFIPPTRIHRQSTKVDLWLGGSKSIGFLLSSSTRFKCLGKNHSLHRIYMVLYTECQRPKINRVPTLIINNLHVKFENDWTKIIVVCIVLTQLYTQSAKVYLDIWPKINRDPPLINNNLHMTFESDLAKTIFCILVVPTRQSMTDASTHSPNHTRTAALLYPLQFCREGIIRVTLKNSYTTFAS